MHKYCFDIFLNLRIIRSKQIIALISFDVSHHIHSEASVLIGNGYGVAHMIVFLVESSTDIYFLPIVRETKNTLRCAHFASRNVKVLDNSLALLRRNRKIKVCGEDYCPQYNGKGTRMH